MKIKLMIFSSLISATFAGGTLADSEFAKLNANVVRDYQYCVNDSGRNYLVIFQPIYNKYFQIYGDSWKGGELKPQQKAMAVLYGEKIGDDFKDLALFSTNEYVSDDTNIGLRVIYSGLSTKESYVKGIWAPLEVYEEAKIAFLVNQFEGTKEKFACEVYDNSEFTLGAFYRFENRLESENPGFVKYVDDNYESQKVVNSRIPKNIIESDSGSDSNHKNFYEFNYMIGAQKVLEFAFSAPEVGTKISIETNPCGDNKPTKIDTNRFECNRLFGDIFDEQKDSSPPAYMIPDVSQQFRFDEKGILQSKRFSIRNAFPTADDAISYLNSRFENLVLYKSEERLALDNFGSFLPSLNFFSVATYNAKFFSWGCESFPSNGDFSRPGNLVDHESPEYKLWSNLDYFLPANSGYFDFQIHKNSLRKSSAGKCVIGKVVWGETVSQELFSEGKKFVEVSVATINADMDWGSFWY